MVNLSGPEAEYYKKLYKLGLHETADIVFSHTTLFPIFDKNGRFESIGFTMTVEIQFKTDK